MSTPVVFQYQRALDEFHRAADAGEETDIVIGEPGPQGGGYRKLIRVEVDTSRLELHIDCAVAREGGTGRAVLEGLKECGITFRGKEVVYAQGSAFVSQFFEDSFRFQV